MSDQQSRYEYQESPAADPQAVRAQPGIDQSEADELERLEEQLREQIRNSPPRYHLSGGAATPAETPAPGGGYLEGYANGFQDGRRFAELASVHISPPGQPELTAPDYRDRIVEDLQHALDNANKDRRRTYIQNRVAERLAHARGLIEGHGDHMAVFREVLLAIDLLASDDILL